MQSAMPEEKSPKRAVMATGPYTRARRIALVIARHAAPLVALLVFDSSIDTYLLLVLFDLGVGYAGQQLRHGTMTTRYALATAESLTERLLAWLQLPMMMALGGALFIGTALLLLFPWLWPRLQEAWDVDSRTILACATAVSITAALQMDRAMAAADADSPASRARADHGAKTVLALFGLFLLVALYAVALGGDGNRGMWLLAVVFAAVHSTVDLGWWRITPRD